MNGKDILNKMKTAAGFTPSSSHTGKGRCKINDHQVSHGFNLVKGKSRHPMEDCLVAEFKRDKNHDLGLFAIYDGHLGHDVANYLKSHLFDNILNEPEFWNEPRKTIKKVYVKTDGVILENTVKLGPGGSTAVTAILIDGKRLLVANVGDSRAVICRGGTAHQLSIDHEPSIERKRIEKQGGFVTVLPGDVPRVDGQLAVARAFGDKLLKAHLSSEPHVVEETVDSATEFMILASDGLWKVMQNQDAVNLVRNVKDPQAAATRLTEEALSRKSKDDISCIVVRFR
uniref:protein-serine/threonine phosphatase n=1 Tax=Wollemia nobilis TaxID=56998 RepID=A0A0C9S3R7_9CONI